MPSLLILTYGNDINNSVQFTSVDSVVTCKPDLSDFWNIEVIGVTNPVTRSEDERRCQHLKIV